MKRKTTRNAAVVAGLAAVLALSPVAGPVTTAFAEETAPEATAQSVETVDERSFSAKDWGWWAGECHYGWWVVKHPAVDIIHDGFCDLCWAPINKGDCKPGGDDKPEQQQETLTVVFHFADGSTQSVDIETPVGEQVAFSEFVEKLGEEGKGVTWYWAQFDGAEQVAASSQIGGAGDHTVNVYEHKAAEPDPEVYTVSFYSDKDTKVGAVTKGAPTFEVSAYATDLVTLKQLEKDGYELVWKDLHTGEVVPMDTVVTEDMDLVASWQEIEEPGTDPGTDPEKPGTGTDEPGTGSDTQDPADDAGDKTDDATKDDGKSDNTADDKSDDKDALPKTSDATIAVSGIAAVGAALAGAGAFLKRRR